MITPLPQGSTSPLAPHTSSPPLELTAEQPRFRVTFPATFHTTAELMANGTFVGQERAHAALDLGVGIPSSGFNIFVSGLTGVRAGAVTEENTVNGLVSKRLRDLAIGLKAFAPSGEGTESKRPDEQDNHHPA